MKIARSITHVILGGKVWRLDGNLKLKSFETRFSTLVPERGELKGPMRRENRLSTAGSNKRVITTQNIPPMTLKIALFEY